MIIETSDNRFYRVAETGNPHMPHLWNGVEVKLVRGEFVQKKAKSRVELVRKAGCRVVQE